MSRRQKKLPQQKKYAANTKPPIAEAELVQRFSVAAKAKVPEQLRDIELAEPVPYRLSGIARSKLAREASTPLKPTRPDWVSSVVRPRKPPRPSPPRILMHHGRAVQPLLVFAPDDRRTYHDWNYPWGTICKVVTAVGWGSGVIVGPRHVLTASHVVDWSSNGAGSVEVHRSGGTVRARSVIIRVWFYTKATGTNWEEVDEDYAVLVTSSRIGDAFGSFGVREYDGDWDGDRYWWSIGYSGDIGGGNSPLWQRDKWLDEDFWDVGDANSMTTDADTIPGQSGSPMFAWWDGDDGPSVVAVVNSYTSSENWCGGGGALVRLVRHARTQDP
jgi:V8-like Glu-specific endopeptidase